MLENPSNELENVEKEAIEKEREQNALIQRQHEEVFYHAKLINVTYKLVTGALWIIAFLPPLLSILGIGDLFTNLCISVVLLFLAQFWNSGIRTWLVRGSINKKAKSINFLGLEWLKRYRNSRNIECKDAEVFFIEKIDCLIAQVIVNQLKPELNLEKEAIVANIVYGLLEGVLFALTGIGVILWKIYYKPFYIMIILFIPSIVSVFFDSKIFVKVNKKVMNALEEMEKEN